VVVATKDQVSCDLNGEAAILHLERGRYFGLDPVGARIWELVQTPKSVSELHEALLREYAVEPDRLENDLLALLDEMAEQHLIDVDRP
jgi:hypothetical protein